MPEFLNVIALISGGKDSFYSILHCLRHRHKIVALGNIYPSTPGHESHATQGDEVDEQDLNSFMFQTVGHTVVPLYKEALGIPLYRQQILGSPIHTGTTYQPSTTSEDETESLIPLLRTILTAHPEANALSTGAILSTYQRTRVESIAVRLGLVPLSFLWQYPMLSPGKQTALLEDMKEAKLDARIIKVASGGLDESFLWMNVASGEGMKRLEKSMTRFGVNENGAVLGEGGEFETLVLDGPVSLFKGRIVVNSEDTRVVREGGGTAWLSIRKAIVQMKQGQILSPIEDHGKLRIPDLFGSRFWATILNLKNPPDAQQSSSIYHKDEKEESFSLHTTILGPKFGYSQSWMVVARKDFSTNIELEAEDIIDQMRRLLKEGSFQASDIYFTLIMLRSMRDFVVVNKIYGAMFTDPNPPARVTIACGSCLPPSNNIIVQVYLSKLEIRSLRRALHVQSRSYWAPANIGPYSQAQSIPLPTPSGSESLASLVHIAGQIPLIPHTMELLDMRQASIYDDAAVDLLLDFKYQTVLSLQHLWRIGQTMGVSWWSAAVAYLSRDQSNEIIQKARIAAIAWEHQNNLTKPAEAPADGASAESDEPDLWEERYHSGMRTHTPSTPLQTLPDWSLLHLQDPLTANPPPFFAAEVEELPRGSPIEWHALLGLTVSSPLTTSWQTVSGIGTAHHAHLLSADGTLSSPFSYTILMLSYRPEIFDLHETLDRLLAKVETPSATPARHGSPAADGYYGARAAYLDVAVRGLWGARVYAGVVPCRSLWDARAERLAAVLVFEALACEHAGADEA